MKVLFLMLFAFFSHGLFFARLGSASDFINNVIPIMNEIENAWGPWRHHKRVRSQDLFVNVERIYDLAHEYVLYWEKDFSDAPKFIKIDLKQSYEAMNKALEGLVDVSHKMKHRSEFDKPVHLDMALSEFKHHFYAYFQSLKEFQASVKTARFMAPTLVIRYSIIFGFLGLLGYTGTSIYGLFKKEKTAE